MFSGFNLKLSENFFSSNESYSEYENLYLRNISKIYTENLEEYIMRDTMDGNCLNGTAIQNDWFPTVQADIFISHSHVDEKLANAFAGWLYYNFGLISFIDSNVWGYVDELLKLINDEYSYKTTVQYGCLYDYDSCNKASQHTNIMLLMALQNMIDKVESVFLLNTDQSIKVFEEDCINSTYSPWIYSEIICTRFIRKKPLINYRCKEDFFIESLVKNELANTLKVKYDVSLEHLKNIDEKYLSYWMEKFEEGNYANALDALYEITYKAQLNETKKISEELGWVYD